MYIHIFLLLTMSSGDVQTRKTTLQKLPVCNVKCCNSALSSSRGLCEKEHDFTT